MSAATEEAVTPQGAASDLFLEIDGLQAMERKHFLMYDVGTAVAFIIALLVLPRTGIGVLDVGVLVFMYILGSFGVEIGYHRFFSHRAFKAGPSMRAAITILASMAAQGPPLTWAATHRHHHVFSDQPQDPHSPYNRGKGFFGMVRGFFHSHLFWKWEYAYPNPLRYIPDLLKDTVVRRVSSYYHFWILLGILLPAVLTGLLSWSWIGLVKGALLGGVVRLYVQQHLTWAVNSLCHMAGRKPFRSGDESRNIALLSPFTMGGTLHNAHHAFAFSARNSLLWWEIDPGYWSIRLLERLGLVWDVRVPNKDQIEQKRVAAVK